jgi:hypothetical protein
MNRLVIVRVFKKADGGMTRSLLGAPQGYGDYQQALPVLEKLLNEYPERGWNAEEGHWARDTQGQKFNFVIH